MWQMGEGVLNDVTSHENGIWFKFVYIRIQSKICERQWKINVNSYPEGGIWFCDQFGQGERG